MVENEVEGIEIAPATRVGGEIDTAMKLGINYFMGLFEWGRVIGLARVYGLLDKLSQENTRYTPANLLKKEASDL